MNEQNSTSTPPNEASANAAGQNNSSTSNAAQQNTASPSASTPEKSASEGQNNTSASTSGFGAGTSDPATIQQELEKIQNELEQNKNQLEQMTGIAKQALADLQNFRRRAQEDQKNYTQYANADLILHLLPALENLGRALTHDPKDESWIQGITQILKQFWQILEKVNVKAIESLNKPFDPNIHEALMTGPGQKDTVTEEFEKGYMLGEKVLKRARVKVGNGEEMPPTQN